MNFFENQAAARSASRRMVLLFAIAVILIVAAIDGVALFGFDAVAASHHQPPPAPAGIVIGVSLAVLAVIGLASLYKIVSLADGGSAVALGLGAILVPPDTTDRALRRLRNVVEEIAIASGVPVPQLFILENEPGINAFAAGYSPADAVITVTRGALDKLSRDQLQGVIAHEFSHLLNGDMRLNIRLMGLLYGILVLSIIGREVLWWTPSSRDRDSRNSNLPIMAIAFALLVFGSIGVFFGRLIKASVSRSREYLADASAVQFTRQTAGLAGALKKAAGIDEGTRLVSAHAEEVAHMLFGEGLAQMDIFATHPPLLARIKRLDPQFRAEEIRAAAVEWNAPGYHAEADDVSSNFAASPPRATAVDASTSGEPTFFSASPNNAIDLVASTPLTAAKLIARTASPAGADYVAAAAISQALPDNWRAAMRDSAAVVAGVLALAVQAPAALRERQLTTIATAFGVAMRGQVEALLAVRDQLASRDRLPLLAIALPSLRRRPKPELLKLIETLNTLIAADGVIDVFEYCLARIVREQLETVMAPAASGGGRRTLSASRDAVATLFAVLAGHGAESPDAARRAFLNGINAVMPRWALNYVEIAAWPQALDAALTELDGLEPAGKQLLLEGIVAVIADDGHVTAAESDLLRAICTALHCPQPAVLGEAEGR